MGDSGLGSELVEAGSGTLMRLLANIYEFVVIIEDLKFECHSYPFALKSSYFKNSIQDFKSSEIFKVAGSAPYTFPRQERPIPEFRLVLPGGCQTFELIRNYCYDSSVTITKENVLCLLSASNLLGFTEDVAPGNLLSRCQRFIDEESKNHGVQGILSMLAHSTIDDAAACDLLITKLAEHTLEFQSSDDEHTREIVQLLSELIKLHPRIVDAVLGEFGRLGVSLVDFFWCRELPTDSDVLLGCDENSQTNGRSIFSYFREALDNLVAAGEVQTDRADLKKLVMLLNPGVFRRPMLSEDIIKAHVSSNLSHLEFEDILDLHPSVVRDLVLRAASGEPSNSIQHLAGLVDRALLFEAERNPWDGSTDAKEKFKEIATCVPLNERISHDLLYDAVENFSHWWFTDQNAEDIWKMVDMDKLSETKFEAAIALTLSRYDNRFVRLLRRRQDDTTRLLNENLYLKRKLSVIEEDESKRKSIKMNRDSCGSPQFTVFVRSLDGTLSSLLVESDTTVNTIKEAIAQSFRSDRFWWPVYQGKKLLESDTIASCGIQKDCTLSIKVLPFKPERELSGWSQATNDNTKIKSDIPSSSCVCGCGCK